MKKSSVLIVAIAAGLILGFSWYKKGELHLENQPENSYHKNVYKKITDLTVALDAVLKRVKMDSVHTVEQGIDLIHDLRNQMKLVDPFLRYADPLAHKAINGPLPVEWETEVFEKFEKPYKRIGRGFTQAELSMDATNFKQVLLDELTATQQALKAYNSDSIHNASSQPAHFHFVNRLFLLNCAAIYTTGYECPDTSRIIPELKIVLNGMEQNYVSYNASFPSLAFPATYINLFKSMQEFVANQSENYSLFNHFQFIKDYVVPLFAQQTAIIQHYNLRSTSVVDYSLNKQATGLFSKNLYQAQNTKGVFNRVNNEESWQVIRSLGEQLFFDTRLSGNGKRSCGSCHQPDHAFAEPLQKTLHLDGSTSLLRNTPSLINVQFQHLLMQDGAHISLSDQIKGVIENSEEMGGDLANVLEFVKKDKKYKKSFNALLKWTPQEPNLSIEHIVSAMSVYIGSLGMSYSDFDRMMNAEITANKSVEAGFNLFMSRSQCATCHFVPQFNGVKPPYVGSEFEVLGIPDSKNHRNLDADLGRARVFDAAETRGAFRTSTLRNIKYTAPYMHNGVFQTLDEVIEWYNNGGGVGHGFQVENQTASADSLRLTPKDVKLLKQFMESLTETEVSKRMVKNKDEASK